MKKSQERERFYCTLFLKNGMMKVNFGEGIMREGSGIVKDR